MPKKINASKGKNTKVNNRTKAKGNNLRKAVKKNVRNTSKSCPVGKVCFGFQLNVRHLALLLLIIVVVLLIILFYKHHKDNSNNESPNLLSNFQNLGKKLENNKKKTENNNSLDKDSEPEKPNITINYHVNPETKNNVSEILESSMPIPPINTSTFLINKDYERVINPLEPPERRNFHMQASGLEMERLVAPRGVPINIPTRGYTGGIMQVGVLHKEEVSDDTKKIGQNTEPVILPLFGRPTYNGSNKWSYYTSTDKMNQVKLPISNKNKVCNSEYGCEELYDGDTVSVPAYNGDFKVSIYEFDKPRYIPYV